MQMLTSSHPHAAAAAREEDCEILRTNWLQGFEQPVHSGLSGAF